jgi:hypothetical protein
VSVGSTDQFRDEQFCRAPIGLSLFIKTPPFRHCTVCVVIPARDEADSIAGTLNALAHQTDLAGKPLPRASYEIILLANNCQDATASIARHFAATYRNLILHVVEMSLPLSDAHVGTARRLAMDEACHRLLSVGRPRGVIATTDADTQVSPHWLAATLHEIELGAEAVGGRIMVSAEERRVMVPSVRERFLRNVGYGALANEVVARIDPPPGDPWPCHEQFSGASLAVTARTYRQVGGLPALPSGEDTALAQALLRADIGIRHSPYVRVHTSGRLDGRTPAGLAASLASWSELSPDDQFQLVPSAATVVARAQGRRSLRDLWASARANRTVGLGDVAQLAEFARVPQEWLHVAVATRERFGPLLADFEARSSQHQDPVMVDVREAITDLRGWLATYREQSARLPVAARQVAGLPFALPAFRGLVGDGVGYSWLVASGARRGQGGTVARAAPAGGVAELRSQCCRHVWHAQ